MRGGAAVVLLAGAASAFAHRLDEVLQVATISISKDRIRATMFLNPGVAVFRRVIPLIDPNGDGKISQAERRSYADRVRRDLSLSVDGRALTLRLVSFKFPEVGELKKGLGYIQVNLDAAVPGAGGKHRLVLENRHQKSIAAYLVNALVPSDPGLRVTAQSRSFDQSRYTMDYTQADDRAPAPAIFVAPTRL